MSLQRLRAKSLLISIGLHIFFLFLVHHQISGHRAIPARKLEKNGRVEEIAIDLELAKSKTKKAISAKPNKEKSAEFIDKLAIEEPQRSSSFNPPYQLEEIEPTPLTISTEAYTLNSKKIAIPHDPLQPPNHLPSLYHAMREDQEKIKEIPEVELTPVAVTKQEVDLSQEKVPLPFLLEREESMQPSFKKNSKRSSIPSLKSLSTLSWGEFFDYDLVYYPDGDGYIFALTLVPQKDVLFPRMKQHVHFLIDTSHAIQAKRLKTSIHAILRALSILPEEDIISITSFDSKMKRVIRHLPNSASNRKTMRSLTGQIQLGNIFASSDPFKPLGTLLFDNLNSPLMENVILISDGKGLTTKQNNFHLLQNWTAQNQGRIHLHAIATERDKMAPLLDLFCSFNKGKLHQSHSVTGLKRKMQKLAHSIQYPIAKDLHISAYAKDQEPLSLYPFTTLLPALYLNEPLVIWGKSNDLQDFTLFVQGRNFSNWINIKKKISFSKAKPADPNLTKQWDVQRAFKCYDNYFRYQDQRYLLEAKEILSSHQLEPLIQ